MNQASRATELIQEQGAVFSPSLEGFEGPLDLLLSLVRDAEVDLSRVSMAALAEQYIAFLRTVSPEQLQRAAEYLVMAAWLAMLKSRLLLPRNGQCAENDDPSAPAERLAHQIQKLSAMQQVAEAFGVQAQFGREFFGRGNSGTLQYLENIGYSADMGALLRALRFVDKRQTHQKARLKVANLPLLSVDDARVYLKGLARKLRQWQHLIDVVPDQTYNNITISSDNQAIFNKSCLASIFMAALEMQREGDIELKQENLHSSVQIRGVI
ncbi:MAG: segregation/condensation protein A [Alphaproteobacteria bacterium]|nr:segregation/condensation protein A [Alphaproteobacteria bacterium]